MTGALARAGRALRPGPLWAVGLLFACGDGELFVPPVIEGCEDVPREACAILETDCQAAVLALTACLRGVEAPPMPPIRLVDPSELPELYGLEPEPLTEVEQGFEWALVQLGLARAGDLTSTAMAGRLVDGVAAFYDRRDGSIGLVDRDLDRGADLTASILAHELVHYLQDRAELLERAPGSYDRYLAQLAATEGDASLHQQMFLAAVWGLDPRSADYVERFVGFADQLEESLSRESSAFVSAPLSFPYLHGALQSPRSTRGAGSRRWRPSCGTSPDRRPRSSGRPPRRRPLRPRRCRGRGGWPRTPWARGWVGWRFGAAEPSPGIGPRWLGSRTASSCTGPSRRAASPWSGTSSCEARRPPRPSSARSSGRRARFA